MMKGYNSYQYRPTLIDTTPGAFAHCPFCPAPDFDGDGEGYLAMMRKRYRDVAHKRYLQDRLNRFDKGEEVNIIGPFALEATRVLGLLVASRNLKKTG